MGLRVLLLVCVINTVSAAGFSQGKKLDVDFTNSTIGAVLDYLKENIEFIMLDKERFAIVKQQLTQMVKRMDASTRLLFAQNLTATTTDDGNNLIELLFDVFEKELIQMLDLSDQTRRAIEGK